MKLDLNGKVALVTGGARGIGLAICTAFTQAGAHVIINYHRSKEAAEKLRDDIETHGGVAQIVQADIGKPEEVAALFGFIRKDLDRLDILVNNAGIIKDNLLLRMELTEWDRVHDVNLRGAFLCTRYALEMMMPYHAGKVINIASVNAMKGGRGQVNYVAAKGGLIAFTRACAVELSGKGIQVNAVLPGMIVTEMSQRIRKRVGDRMLKEIPSERFGEPIDVANLVLFLASDKSNYITGQAVAVDGGLSIS